MVLTKVVALAILLISFYIFILGVKYKEQEKSAAYLTRINIFGTSILLGILGYYLLRSEKSLCELFSVFCY